MSEKFWTNLAKVIGFPVLGFYAYELANFLINPAWVPTF